jgi:hypothetical protein
MPREIPPGFDFFRTRQGIFKFDQLPIPEGFFSRGSAPFTRVVRFRGRALPARYFNGQDIRHVDTVVERKQGVTFTTQYPCESPPIPIELVGLALESISPLKVQVGRRVELWAARAEVSTAWPSEGQMVITKQTAQGGTFNSELNVYPRLTFTRECDGRECVLDVGELLGARLGLHGLLSGWKYARRLEGKLWPSRSRLRKRVLMRSSESPWSHVAPSVLLIPGLNDHFVAGAPGHVEEDGDASTHEIDEPPACDVSIRAESRCLSLGRSRAYIAHVVLEEGATTG